MQELWRFLRSRTGLEQEVEADVRHRYLSILADLDRMREADGHDGWRKQVHSTVVTTHCTHEARPPLGDSTVAPRLPLS